MVDIDLFCTARHALVMPIVLFSPQNYKKVFVKVQTKCEKSDRNTRKITFFCANLSPCGPTDCSVLTIGLIMQTAVGKTGLNHGRVKPTFRGGRGCVQKWGLCVTQRRGFFVNKLLSGPTKSRKGRKKWKIGRNFTEFLIFDFGN